ncbi:MAG TPA: heme-binding domain-containing protein [Ginsengibacter sp.]
MKIFRKILILLLVALITIQFIKPKKNISANKGAYDITSHFVVPNDIENILKISCYDCHSNNTIYPWYWQIQPVTWFMNGHIKDAKRALNFSIFTSYNAGKQYKEFDHINNEVKRDDMPISSYTLIHRNAILTDSKRLAIYNWTQACRKQMETTYSPDSLKTTDKRRED